MLVRAIKSWPGVVDVVVARDQVAAYFDSDPIDSTIDAAIAQLSVLHATAEPGRSVELRTVYDGEDLAAVASASGLTIDEVVRRHAAATYTVETMGFAPGFAYMTGLDPQLVLPRRATPRTRVPAGSIAVAGEHTAVYPFDSPGGWHLVGRVVGVKMFGDDGALLRLGDRVRFVGEPA
ncbi:MAG: allophanate hydrolase subunit 1 [Deltaproteobacteria bacterium]|nr:allophanate hydrolase subunit 1 [Deltaproteobacteria bacterium]